MYRAAVLTGVRRIETCELPEPEVGEKEILVRVRSANLCRTDFRKWSNKALEPHLDGRKLILGHEIAGEVIKTGDGVKAVRKGALVAVNPVLPCNACDACRRGLPEACTQLSGIGAAAGSVERNLRQFEEHGIGGGFSEIVKIPERAAVPLPPEMGAEAGSLVEPLSDVCRSVEAAGAVQGLRCGVYGLGVMGLLHVEVLQSLGAQVVAIEPSTARRERARSFGAAVTVPPGEEGELDTGFIAVGGAAASEAARAAVASLRARGTVVLFSSGPPGATLELDINQLHYRCQQIIGVVGAEDRHVQWAIRLLLDGAVSVARLRQPLIGLDDVQQAFEEMERDAGLKPALNLGPS